LTILQKLVKTLELPADIVANASALLAVPPTIIKSDTEYEWDPWLLLQAREQVAELIEKIMQSKLQPKSSDLPDHDSVNHAPAVAASLLCCVFSMASLMLTLF